MNNSSASETTRFLCAIWQTATGEKEVFVSRKQSFKAAQDMLRRYWKLPDTAEILFELERSRGNGTSRRGGIPPEIWAEVLESPIESIFVTVVHKQQEPSRRYARIKQVQSTAQTPTPAPTFSAGSSSSRHTTTSEGEEYCGGAVRSSKKKHHNSTLFRGRKRPPKARRRAKGTVPCRQCLNFGISCVLHSPTAFLCANCKTYGLPCSNKPIDIGKIEHALRSRNLSPDTRGSVSSAVDSEQASGRMQDDSAEHVIGVGDSGSDISDSEEYDELQD